MDAGIVEAMPQSVSVALGIVMSGLNLAYWWFVAMRGQRRFRDWVMRRFNVVITAGWRGHWRVSGPGSWLRLRAIEYLHLGYFMAAYAVWAVLLFLCIGILGALDR